MILDNLFWIAFQSSFILGLVHGVNPCGHSWLVLAPFVVGTKDGRKVSFLTITFLLGTTVACLILGVTLGAISQTIPPGFQFWVDIGTAAILIALGAVLVIKPHLLHHHDHDHDHDHKHEHGQDHNHGHDHACSHHHHHGESCCCPTSLTTAGLSKKQTMTGTALFGIGFVNMIIPCPTVAIMYSYALDSGSYLNATAVFGIYALGTSLAVGAVIYAIHKVTTLLKTLCQDWIEGAIMRTAGVMTIFFGAYALTQNLT